MWEKFLEMQQAINKIHKIPQKASRLIYFVVLICILLYICIILLSLIRLILEGKTLKIVLNHDLISSMISEHPFTADMRCYFQDFHVELDI